MKRAHQFAKLHHPDPSGFWNLVRSGGKLPVVGQQILYVVDIRGTKEESFQQLLTRVADGDPYRCGIIAKKQEGDKIYEHEVMLDELLKLPTKVTPPESRVGIVEAVEFDKVLQEWYISVQSSRGWPGFNTNPDHIVYWAPMPTPPNTYTARDDATEDLWSFNHQRGREQRVVDYLETRQHRKNHD